MPTLIIRRKTKSSIKELEGAFVPPSDSLLAGKRCLVLDDESLIALDIQEILETAGAAKVICVSDEAAALAALDNEPPFDLAVLDVILSGATKNSLGIAAALAQQKIPFIFLTGVSGEGVHTMKFPSAPVLEKPYQTPVFLETVLRALGSR